MDGLADAIGTTAAATATPAAAIATATTPAAGAAGATSGATASATSGATTVAASAAAAAELARLVERLPFWNDLTEPEKEWVLRTAQLRTYGKGQAIHSGSRECLGMITVVSGSVRTYLVSEEGREVTLFRLHKGDPCILSASCVITQIDFETLMVAERDCRLLIVGSRVVARLAEQNIHFRCFMYELMMEHFSDVVWTMQEILFKGFDRRLAAFLVEEFRRTGSHEIGMTQEEIARQTSSAREVVTRMLKRFAAEGLIEYRRGSVTLKDMAGLRSML